MKVNIKLIALKVKDRSGGWVCPNDLKNIRLFDLKGWLAIAKLKPFSLFISLLLMLKKAEKILQENKTYQSAVEVVPQTSPAVSISRPPGSVNKDIRF